MNYAKPPLSILDQIALLKERGLLIQNEKRARHYLTYIGYYRFSAYWLSFEYLDKQGKRTHRFKKGTSFDDVLGLYIFDRKLRLLVMEAMERIEVAIRTYWSNEFSMKHGSHAFMDQSLFKKKKHHQDDLNQIKSYINDSKEIFVQHYLKTYTTPDLPPIWAIVETLSFGSLSKWFSNTKENNIKAPIAKNLGFPKINLLDSVLHALTNVRNICAHHGRLWNRKFTTQIPFIKQLKNELVVEHGNQTSRKLYNYLVIIIHIMHHINNGSSWRDRVKEHIKTCNLGVIEMGFPNNWGNSSIWN